MSAPDRRPRGEIAVALAVSTAASIAFAIAVHAALDTCGLVLLGRLGLGGSGSLPVAFATLLACVVAAVIAAVFAVKSRAPLPAWARLAAVTALYVAIRYPPSLRHEPLNFFGPLSTSPPNSTYVEPYANRPRVTYRNSARGFREPGWDLAKRPGTKRIALIGDSFVYGIGVEQDGTLAARLGDELARRAPGESYEVLNLGIPGDNLSSHVDLYAEAAKQLDPDIAVICLVLPNDLSRWDGQAERRAARRPSALSFARLLMGDGARALWDHFLLENDVTPAGLAHLDAELARLGQLRATPSAPKLILLTYSDPDAEIARRLSALPNARFLPVSGATPDDFIQGDGHPTAAGNTRFAAAISDVLQ